MSHAWDRGVFTAEKQASSWHQFADMVDMVSAADLISKGERSGALPTAIRDKVALHTSDGIGTDIAWAVVASYAQHPDRVVGVNGERYRANTPAEYRQLVTDIVATGAQPSGIFSLRQGRQVLSTFELTAHGDLHTHLLLVDSFDGSTRTSLGSTTIDVVCANTLAMSQRDAGGWATVPHSACAAQRLPLLASACADAIAEGAKVADTYARAMAAILTPVQAKAAFDAVFPPAADDASPRAKTAAENARDEARAAAMTDINRRGNTPGTLATLWNTATYLVDREADGTARATRSATSLDSILFGRRAERVAEVMALVEVILADGTVQAVSVPQATAMGVPGDQLGSSLLASILDDC
jgi:hypothetical protein